METILVAYYFTMLLNHAEVPELVGPYESWSACASVREWVSGHFEGVDTGGCGLMPFPQAHSIFMNVFDLAPQYGWLHQENASGDTWRSSGMDGLQRRG